MTTVQFCSRSARTWIGPVFCPGASVLLRARARQLWKSELEYAAMLPQPAAPDNHTDCHTSRSEHDRARLPPLRSEEHTSELQSLMRISYAVFCLKKKNTTLQH